MGTRRRGCPVSCISLWSVEACPEQVRPPLVGGDFFQESTGFTGKCLGIWGFRRTQSYVQTQAFVWSVVVLVFRHRHCVAKHSLRPQVNRQSVGFGVLGIQWDLLQWRVRCTVMHRGKCWDSGEANRRKLHKQRSQLSNSECFVQKVEKSMERLLPPDDNFLGFTTPPPPLPENVTETTPPAAQTWALCVRAVRRHKR